MTDSIVLDRRTFLADLGRGAFVVAVLAVAGCAPAGTTASPRRSTGPAASGGAPASAGATAAASPETPSASASPAGSLAAGDVRWERVNLGFVSAYLAVRAGEAALVDTGVGGSADQIEAAMAELGLDWGALGHVVLTHNHADHAGSAAEILELASGATGYAGADDLPSITVPRPLRAVADGDEVFGLGIVATPGHTPGSISVLDREGGVLVAGDALVTDTTGPATPPAQFTADMDEARRSIMKLGGLTFERLLVGHGDPIESGASTAVAELAASFEAAASPSP